MNKQEIEKAIKTLEKLKSKGCVKFEVDGYPCSSFIEIEPILTALEHQLTDMWIPCKDRLPEDSGLFLTSHESGYVNITGYSSDEWNYRDIMTRIIAWQPLPEPWKETV